MKTLEDKTAELEAFAAYAAEMEQKHGIHVFVVNPAAKERRTIVAQFLKFLVLVEHIVGISFFRLHVDVPNRGVFDEIYDALSPKFELWKVVPEFGNRDDKRIPYHLANQCMYRVEFDRHHVR
jgi:hypothetical protein